MYFQKRDIIQTHVRTYLCILNVLCMHTTPLPGRIACQRGYKGGSNDREVEGEGNTTTKMENKIENKVKNK